MSGNVWMFSDQIDDEDVEFMTHDFVTYNMACDYYRLGLKPVTRMAHEAGAVYKIGKDYWTQRSHDFGAVRKNELENEMGQRWLREIQRFLPEGGSLDILDVGTGTRLLRCSSGTAGTPGRGHRPDSCHAGGSEGQRGSTGEEDRLPADECRGTDLSHGFL